MIQKRFIEGTGGGRKYIDQPAILVEEIFLEIPTYRAVFYAVSGLIRQPQIYWMNIRTFYADFGRKRKSNPKADGAKRLNRLIGSGFLPAKIIGRKPNHHHFILEFCKKFL